MASWKVAGLGLVVGSDLAAGNPAQGWFDELTTFDYWPDAEAQKFYYTGVSRQVALGPVGTEEEERAKQASLMAVSGAMLAADSGANGPMEASYSTNDLFLEITGVTNNVASLIVRNTQPDVSYEILSKLDLTDTNWSSELSIIGAADQDWTPTDIATLGRTNLFLWAKSWIDTDGGGLPDWWQLQYFGNLGVDPYGDPDGDGWNNLQEFLNGTNPNQFNTPPPPQNILAYLDATGSNVIVSWQSVGGPVIEYKIQSYYNGELGSVGPGATSSTNALPVDSIGNFGDYYWVEAVTTNGASAVSESVYLSLDELWTDAKIVRGAGGQFYLTLLSPATNLASVRLTGATSFDVSISAFTNGVAALPKEQTESSFQGWYAYARGITTDGKMGGVTETLLQDSWWLSYWPEYHEFANASAQLKQNLQFLLRSATVNHEFGCYTGTADWFTHTLGYSPYYAESTNDYAYAGFLGGWTFDGILPVEQHFVWRNFIYNSADGIGIWTAPAYDPENGNILGWGGTGAAYLTNQQTRVVFNAPYQYSGFTNSPPLAFTLNNSSYLYYRNLVLPYDDATGFAELGLVPYTDGRVALNNGARNFYGLSLTGVQVLNSNLVWTVSPGSIIGPLNTNESSRFFAQVASPNLQTVSYYFNTYDYFGNTPGDDSFSTTNVTPLLVAGFGQPVLFTGWAKQEITNGYPNKFAYLQQYFDKAYKVGSNGVTTTNQTGILSPYGEFFATETGPVALVTLPDIETGQRGTGVVQVVKIQFDVNHDGIMDLSLTGPDNTSFEKPFTFWANNDCDRGHTVDSSDFEEDDLGPKNINKLPVVERVPDHQFTTNGLPAIPCQRDLEDYTRMWIPGLASLMVALPTNYTVQLASDGVALRIFRATESAGGTNYLTDDITAQTQVTNSTSLYLGVLAYGFPIVLNGKTNLSEHFIFCGTLPGSAAVSLQVLDQNQNLVGSTTAYIQIKDIKDMYERWTLGERPYYVPTNIAQRATENLPPGENTPFQYDSPTDTNTPYIVYVHGWNMETWEKDRYAETAFKRLYWQGYEGRFGSFRWPTGNRFVGDIFEGWNNPLTDPHNYDNSEFTAWKSATGLLNKLNDLNSKYPSHVYLLAHSMGNVVAGEALRLLGTNQTVNTYVASQAAIPAHVYDSTVTNLIDFTHKNPSYPFSPANFGPTTPNIYGNRLAGNSAAVGRRINFYNANDYALSPDAWCFDQELKPDTFFGGSYSYAGSTNDAAPWNHFEFIPTGESALALDIVTNLQDRYEVLAYAAEPRSKALGATPGIITFDDRLDLTAIWPTDTSGHSYADHKWHSAEFRSNNMRQQNYWRTLLRSGSQGFNIQ